jgi:hypothetical protein
MTTHTIRYRRPEAMWSVARMVVDGEPERVRSQIKRLTNLGYTVIDVVPPVLELNL